MSTIFFKKLLLVFALRPIQLQYFYVTDVCTVHGVSYIRAVKTSSVIYFLVLALIVLTGVIIVKWSLSDI